MVLGHISGVVHNLRVMSYEVSFCSRFADHRRRGKFRYFAKFRIPRFRDLIDRIELMKSHGDYWLLELEIAPDHSVLFCTMENDTYRFRITAVELSQEHQVSTGGIRHSASLKIDQ